MRRIAKFLSVAPIAFAIAMAGCDSAQNLTAPKDVSAQFGVKQNAKRAHASVTPGHNSAVVDANGATILVNDNNGHLIAALVVPAGTVKKNTTFTIDISTDFTVSLSATSDNGAANDVGHAGFKKGVQLYINRTCLSGTEGVFSVGEIKANGQIFPVVSDDDGSWVVGTLKHFSDYVPLDGSYVPISD